MDTKEFLDAVRKIEDELVLDEPVGEHYFLIRSEVRREALEILSDLVSGDQREQVIARLKACLIGSEECFEQVIAILKTRKN